MGINKPILHSIYSLIAIILQQFADGMELILKGPAERKILDH